MTARPLTALAALTVLALAGMPAAAAPKKATPAKAEAKQGPGGTYLVATYGDWGAYTAGSERSRVCYALSQPKQRQPGGLTRDPAYVFISNRPGDGAKNEFSLIMGYPLKPGSASSATVGAAQFQMLTKDKSAWLKNAAEEPQLLDQMRKGATLIVKGISAKGNETTDTYSLSGLSQAIERVHKECP